jgi:PAN domain-containing protein
LKVERDSALDEVAALKATVEELTQAREHADARVVELSQHLRKVRQSKAQETARSIGAAISPLVIAAAVATLGFWTYQLVWSTPQSLLAVTSDPTPEAEQQRLAAIKEEAQRQAKAAAADAEAKLNAAEAEQQRLKEEAQRQGKTAADLATKLNAAEAEQQRLTEEVQRQTKAAAEAQTKLQAAQTEQQRQARAATDADGKRRAAEAEQQRLKDEVQRQTKAASDAETKLQAALAEQQRLPAALPKSTSAATNKLFEIRRDMEARCTRPDNTTCYSTRSVRSIDECEQRCTEKESWPSPCNAFALDKRSLPGGDHQCYLYSDAKLVPNSNFDSGVRQSAALSTDQSGLTSTTGLFTIRSNTEATSDQVVPVTPALSIRECERKCTESSTCKIFTYSKIGACYLYSRADFKPNAHYDSGIRK